MASLRHCIAARNFRLCLPLFSQAGTFPAIRRTAMTRLFLGFAFVAALAVSVHARTVHPQARIEAANWYVAGAQDLQTAEVQTIIGSSFHAIHTGF
jgi:hypothetical protein